MTKEEAMRIQEQNMLQIGRMLLKCMLQYKDHPELNPLLDRAIEFVDLARLQLLIYKAPVCLEHDFLNSECVDCLTQQLRFKEAQETLASNPQPAQVPLSE